ncbi:MAG: HAD hydrolase family protein [Isosphaeraceae bacterium]|nr:HAD hydrolase family protein [Isosphaeraceae bacterium]
MMAPPTRIKAVALDVDGVLTDGTFWWGANGEEFKRFSFLDVMGVSLGRKAGLIFALISGEDSPLVDRYAAKMGIADVFKGCKDKGAALREFAVRHGLDLAEIAFMGDDVNDVSALSLAGLSAAPANAHDLVLRVVSLITLRPGGGGAVRELVDVILADWGAGAPVVLREEGLG